jgi:hypothetical protein
MATKVFLKWLGTNGENGLTHGKEYVFHKSPLSCEFVVNDSGTTLYTNGLQDYWQRIEREVFTAHGVEWVKHTPGEPMPCEPCAQIHFLTERNETYKAANGAGGCCWGFASSIIGWRYADSEQKEPQNIACGPKIVGVDFAEDESTRNDLIAAVDDGHLTPGQKAYINAKEEKVAERLRSEAAKEELKRADHGKSIQDLANANGAMKFEHDPRMGWPS